MHGKCKTIKYKISKEKIRIKKFLARKEREKNTKKQQQHQQQEQHTQLFANNKSCRDKNGILYEIELRAGYEKL